MDENQFPGFKWELVFDSLRYECFSPPTSIKLISGLISSTVTKILSSASFRQAMNEPHRHSQQRQKRQDKQKQEETSHSHPEECENPARKQERQPVRTLVNLYDVSNGGMDLSDTNNPKAEAKSKRFGVYMDEEQKDDWLKGSSGLDLGLTPWESKPMATRDMNKLVNANTPGQNTEPVMKLSRKGNSTSDTTLTPLLSPQDIPDYLHPLRQHATKNAEGDILLYGVPAGSNAARSIIPLAYKANYPGHTPLALKQLQLKYYRAKNTVALCKVDERIQRLNLIEGDIVEFRSELRTGNNKEDRKYLLQRWDNSDVIGWVLAKDLEAVYDPKLLLDQTKGKKEV